MVTHVMNNVAQTVRMDVKRVVENVSDVQMENMGIIVINSVLKVARINSVVKN